MMDHNCEDPEYIYWEVGPVEIQTCKKCGEDFQVSRLIIEDENGEEFFDSIAKTRVSEGRRKSRSAKTRKLPG